MLSKVHHCVGQINVAEGRNEPPAPSCRCRKFISIEKATEFVKLGEVSWVVIGRTRGSADVICELCAGDKDVKNCASCNGKGFVSKPVVWDEYNNDIVLVSQLPEDKTEKKRSSILKKKTPRVATIEAPHIERAYVYGKKEAQQRIEQYGEMNIWNLHELGAEITKGGKVIAEGKVEPENDAKRAIGRDYDYGRTL
jgi:hypothetical protein